MRTSILHDAAALAAGGGVLALAAAHEAPALLPRLVEVPAPAVDDSLVRMLAAAESAAAEHTRLMHRRNRRALVAKLEAEYDELPPAQRSGTDYLAFYRLVGGLHSRVTFAVPPLWLLLVLLHLLAAANRAGLAELQRRTAQNAPPPAIALVRTLDLAPGAPSRPGVC